MNRPRVHLYTVCWDEADMLGFFFRHYAPWVEQFVVYDDGSTDGSLEILHARSDVKVRTFEKLDAASFVLSHTALQNEVWKESRGRADWVVVTAIDEHLHVRGRAMSDYLTEQRAAGATLLPALGFDLNHPVLPVDEGVLVEEVTSGRPRIFFNKLSIFDPVAVRETGFDVGRHTARPIGDLRLPRRDDIMLWHYKHLGFARNAEREQAQGRRLGRTDRERGLAEHYSWNAEQRRNFWDEMERHSVDLSAADFEPDRVCVRPLWWCDRPNIQRISAAPPRPSLAASSEPTVSVLVKAYNHAPYVQQTIDSLLDQTFQDFEIVVTDDCSTDGTLEILRRMDDPRVRLEASTRNRGISLTMNATLARARGRYLAILNSDDWALPQRLAAQVAYLDRNPSVSAVFGMPRTVGEHGEDKPAYFDFAVPLRFPNFSIQSWLRQFFFHGNCLCAPTAMIRRDVFDTLGAYDPRLTNLQDFDMWMRMLIAGREIQFLHHPLTAFRIRDNNANMSAPRPDAVLRHHFELSHVLRRLLDLDAEAFEATFGLEAAATSGQEDPVHLRLALLALEQPNIAYKMFALNLLYETACDQASYDRLRELSGKVDVMAIEAVLQLSADREAWQGEATELRSQTAAMQSEIAALKEAQKQLVVEVNKERNGVATLERARTLLECEIDRQRAAAKTSLGSLEQMRRSHSWRSTAPLRAVGRLARKMRRAVWSS